STDLFTQFAEQLNSEKLHGTHKDGEWADLLSLLFTKVPRAFVVIETQSLHRAYQQDPHWQNRFILLLQRIIDNTAAKGHCLKVLLVVYGSSSKDPPCGSSSCDVIVTSLKSAGPVPPRFRHMVRRSGLNARGWKLQTPKV
ncbi:hypothetical protein EK21DRAFT_54399, partial [Setomelanomma holmii]